MTRPRPLLAALALASLAGGLLPSAASADVIRLRTGETVKGKLLEQRSDERVIVIEDYLSGAVREFAWQALDPADYDRLWFDVLQLGARGVGTVFAIMGETIVVKQSVGTQEVRGVVEEDEPGKPLAVKTAAGRLSIERARIVSREATEIDGAEVYTPEELYEKYVAKDQPQTSRDWWRLAQRAEQVEAYEKAKEAYEQVASDPSSGNAEAATKKVAQMTALLKDVEAMKALRALKQALGGKLFASVRDGIARFPEQHPEASEAVQKKLEDVKKSFETERKAYFSKQAGDRFPRLVAERVKKKVRPKDTPITEVIAWTRKELPAEAFADLAKGLQSNDAAVTEEEAKGFWDARPKRANSWKTTSYGSGSFIVNPPQLKPPQNRGGGGGGGRQGGNQGPAVSYKPPPVPTRDTWWQNAGQEEKEKWMFAYFVENSGLFEVDPKKVKTPCSVCLGEGLIHKALSNGGELVYLCTRCAGAQSDISIKWK